VFDLQSPDGLLGSYLFARCNTDELKIVDDVDPIERYVEKNPAMTVDRLRAAFEKYKETRKPSGYPVVLIYDGQKNIQVESVNPDANSELAFAEPIDSDKLKIMLVPESRIAETEKLLVERNFEIEVLPIEILEVLK
jgi:hypothetical protein